MPQKDATNAPHKRARAFQGVFIILLAVTVVFGTNVALFSYQQDQTQPLQEATAREAAIFTTAEIAIHDTSKDCWIIVNDGVYDITAYVALESHPGGQTSLITGCGKNVTTDFQNSHSARALQSLEKYKIGKLTQ